MTKNGIINQTVKFYSEDPSRRALNENGGCVYRNDEGNKCAVGRCFNEKKANFLSDLDAKSYDKEYCLDNHLKKKYKGHSIEFWDDLQGLHDSSYCWNSQGLTEQGKAEVKRLKNKWK